MTGSSLLEDGIHQMDVMHWLVNARPTRIYATGGNNIFKDRETIDHAGLLMDYENGVKFAFNFSIFALGAMARASSETVVLGSEGMLKPEGGKVALYKKKGGPVKMVEAETATDRQPQDGTYRQYLAFRDSIRTGKQPVCDGEAGKQAAKIGLLAEKSIHERRAVNWNELVMTSNEYFKKRSGDGCRGRRDRRAQTTPPRIRVGCQTRAYGSPIRDRAQLLSALDDLAASGYEGFETNFASLEASFDDPAPMRASSRSAASADRLHGTVSFISPDSLEKDRAQLDRLAKASKGLGAELLVLSSSHGVPRDSDGRVDGVAMKLRCEELNRAGAICGTLGLRLAVHNHANETANNGEEVETILARSDPKNVSLLMDIAYVNGAHINVPAFFRKHYSRVAGLHVRDHQGAKEVNLGEGEIDLKGLADALHDTRWSGWVILEVNKRTDISSRQLVESSRKFMRDVMKI